MAVVGIVVRTKNRPVMLARALESIFEQSYADFEVVVVNDGGVDITDVVARFQSHPQTIRVISHPESRGMEAASNVGVRATATEYVVLLDDDDTWHSQFLQKTVSFLNSQEGAHYIGVATHSKFIFEKLVSDSGDTEYQNEMYFNPNLLSLTILDIFRINPIFVNAFVYRKSVFEAVGGYDESLRVVGDWDFNIRAIMTGDVAIIPEPLAYYHQRLSSNSSTLGNTIVTNKLGHARVDAQIRNKYMRAQLREDPTLAGVLLQQGGQFHFVDRRIQTLEDELLIWRKLNQILLKPLLIIKRMMGKLR